jgi:hypothetical protein
VKDSGDFQIISAITCKSILISKFSVKISIPHSFLPYKVPKNYRIIKHLFLLGILADAISFETQLTMLLHRLTKEQKKRHLNKNKFNKMTEVRLYLLLIALR